MAGRITVLLGIATVIFSLFWVQSTRSGQNPRMIIMGDSLSAYQSSWPQQFRFLVEEEYNVQIMAQPGRSIRDFDPPRDLNTWQNEKVMYFLGGNDALQLSNYLVTMARMKQHMMQLQAAGFDILVLIPPSFDGSTSPIWTEERKKAIVTTRAAMQAVAGELEIPVLDMNNCWDLDRLIDGVHPTMGLSLDMANCIYLYIQGNGIFAD